MKQHLKKHAHKYVGFVSLVVIGVIVFSLAPSRSSQSGKSADCASSTVRPCYDKQTGKNIVTLETKGGENAFDACAKQAPHNNQGQWLIKTAVSDQEAVNYCYEGKSQVVLRKFGGVPSAAANPLCPNYKPVPYFQVYSTVTNKGDISAYPSNPQKFVSGIESPPGILPLVRIHDGQ